MAGPLLSRVTRGLLKLLNIKYLFRDVLRNITQQLCDKTSDTLNSRLPRKTKVGNTVLKIHQRDRLDAYTVVRIAVKV